MPWAVASGGPSGERLQPAAGLLQPDGAVAAGAAAVRGQLYLAYPLTNLRQTPFPQFPHSKSSGICTLLFGIRG